MKSHLYAILGSVLGSMAVAFVESFLFYLSSLGYSKLPPSYGGPILALLGLVITAVHVRGTWTTVSELSENGPSKNNPFKTLFVYRLNRELDWFFPASTKGRTPLS